MVEQTKTDTETEVVEGGERYRTPKKRWRERVVDGRASNNEKNLTKDPGTASSSRDIQN